MIWPPVLYAHIGFIKKLWNFLTLLWHLLEETEEPVLYLYYQGHLTSLKQHLKKGIQFLNCI